VVRDGGPLRPVEQELRDDLLGQAGLALRQVALTARLRRAIELSEARAEQLRESRQRIVATADAARVRLERDIHDGAQQHLVALAVRLRLVRTVAARDPQRAATQLPAVQEAATMASTTLDELSRGLHPRALAEAGVAAALREASATSAVPVEVLDATTRRYPPAVEAAVYFACLEAVQNAVKHAEAQRITVRLGDGLEFEVHDDGRGLADPPPGGTGLSGMRDRIDAAGGTLTVAGRPGGGTTVAGRVPS
jgi:signal transduction histidine kinase